MQHCAAQWNITWSENEIESRSTRFKS